MKFLKPFFVASLLVIVSCSSQETINTLEEELSTIDSSDTSNLGEEQSEPEVDNEVEKPLDLDTFNGAWFSIIFPHELYESPAGPIEDINEYEFIDTDEATFTSKNEDVQFFVYSPQWGGDPENYLDAAANEVVKSDKTTVDKLDENKIYRWVTFKDKDHKYARSLYSKKTESTHLIFGIRYKNQEVYDANLEAYTTFKKSLVQYAD